MPLLINEKELSEDISYDKFKTAEEDLNVDNSGYMSDDECQNIEKKYKAADNPEPFRYLPLQEN